MITFVTSLFRLLATPFPYKQTYANRPQRFPPTTERICLFSDGHFEAHIASESTPEFLSLILYSNVILKTPSDWGIDTFNGNVPVSFHTWLSRVYPDEPCFVDEGQLTPMLPLLDPITRFKRDIAEYLPLHAKLANTVISPNHTVEQGYFAFIDQYAEIRTSGDDESDFEAIMICRERAELMEVENIRRDLVNSQIALENRETQNKITLNRVKKRHRDDILDIIKHSAINYFTEMKDKIACVSQIEKC